MLGNSKKTLVLNLRIQWLFLILASSCSSNPEDKSGVIGEEVSPISQIIEGETGVNGEVESKMFYFDRPSSRILKLSLEPLAVESFLPASLDFGQSNHFVAAGKNASYVVSMANKSFHVIDTQGNIQKNHCNFRVHPFLRLMTEKIILSSFMTTCRV